MSLNEVAVSRPEDIERILKNAADNGINLLLLYEDRVGDALHGFLDVFAKSDERFCIVFSGDRMNSVEEFYEEVSSSVPFADYMGSNLDALNDTLRFEALSPEPDRDNYWIWKNSHVLYERDPESFWSLFEVMVQCSIENRPVRPGPIDNTQQSGSRTPRRLVLILTGRSQILGSHVSRPDSYFFKLTHAPLFRHPSTKVVAYHLK